MNDTILTPRQKFILNLINQSEGLLRDQIQEGIITNYPASKPTIIRDLNVLLNKNLITAKGKARATQYFPQVLNPLLRQSDINAYFVADPDQRHARETFDFKVFKYLNHLFTNTELKALQTECRSFTGQTSKLSPDLLKRELERFTIELSWKSSKIEGNTYTLLETETLIKQQKQAVGRTKDEATMILNHKSAFEAILKNREDFTSLSLSDINQLHNFLTKNLHISSGIRNQPVGITGTVYRPLDNRHQLSEALEKMVSAVNKTKNGPEKALIAGFMIPYIQPYADGNKRTARMLTNAILLAHDVYPLSYRSVNEDEFKKSLILFYEQGSVYAFKRLFIDQLKFANATYFR